MKRLGLFLILAGFVALIHFAPVFDRPEAAVVRALLRVAAVGRSVAAGTALFASGIFSSGKLIAENERLKNEAASALAAAAAAGEALHENETLRDLLNVEKRKDLFFVAANVTGTEPSAGVHAIIIDRGSEAGVAVGDAVVIGTATMIGKIENVSAGRSTVLLTIDPKSAVAALVAGKPESSGVAVGDRGLVVKLGLIPQNAEFKAGDVVVTSGGEQQIPRDLTLGSVDSVNRSPSEPFSSATVIPAYDVSSLTVVAVVHKK